LISLHIESGGVWKCDRQGSLPNTIYLFG